MSFSSPYYPPRATRTSAIRARWRLRMREFETWLPGSFGDWLLSIAVPGYALRAYRQWVGGAATWAYLASVVAFFVWLGYPVGSWILVAMLSIHATSIAFLIKLRAPRMRFRYRIAVMLAVVWCLSTWVYAPIRDAIGAFVVPLQVGNRVVVVRRSPPGDIHRGDWIAYEIGAGSGQLAGLQYQFRLGSGFGLGPVLAVPGDKVEFNKSHFSVNGQQFPAQNYMPESGSFTAPERQWFVWPSVAVAVNIRGVAYANGVTEVLKSNSLVSEKTFVGKPFKYWFWRKQTLDEPL